MPRAVTEERVREIVKRYRPRGWRIRETIWRYEWSCAEACPFTRTLHVPILDDSHGLFLFLHEVGHVTRNDFTSDLPQHRQEFAAERFAFHIFRVEGIPVTKELRENARYRVRIWIANDTKKGIPIQHHIACWAKTKRRCRGSKSSR